MTTSQNAFRGLRLSAVLLAVAVLAGVLTPVTTASASVSETAAERFGGRDRYETSVAVAKAYLEEIADNPDRAETNAAIVASGEDRHAAYAITAVGLASAFDAPILLTPSRLLHVSVADFVELNDIELVLVVGGADVVSAAVERQLLLHADSVRRIWGATASATSVAVAAQVGPIEGSAGRWRSRGRTALLASSGLLADALVAGPLSYHGEHPLLLTASRELDATVSRYLDRSDVEHVVILGDTAALSSAVETAVRAKGIGVSRIAGANRYATAAALAQQLLVTAPPDPCFDGSTIGVAVGWDAPDAISSGPLLGERCAPLLLTETTRLPTPVDKFLTGDVVLGGTNDRLTALVFGGTSAVNEATVDSVRDRALRGEPFTASVSASAGSKIFRVKFNVDVKEAPATSPVRYTVNGLGLGAGSGQRPYESISWNLRRVTVELETALKAGDTITVIGETNTPEGRTQIAVDDTLPALESVFYRVPKPPVVSDIDGPQVQVVAVAGQSKFMVLVAERKMRSEDRLRNDVIWRGK